MYIRGYIYIYSIRNVSPYGANLTCKELTNPFVSITEYLIQDRHSLLLTKKFPILVRLTYVTVERRVKTSFR